MCGSIGVGVLWGCEGRVKTRRPGPAACSARPAADPVAVLLLAFAS